MLKGKQCSTCPWVTSPMASFCIMINGEKFEAKDNIVHSCHDRPATNVCVGSLKRGPGSKSSTICVTMDGIVDQVAVDRQTLNIVEVTDAICD